MKIKNRIPLHEIEKQLLKIKEEITKAKPNSKKGKEFLDNVKAYITDCEHFLKKGDYVLAFECIVWAWAWYEIGKEIKVL